MEIADLTSPDRVLTRLRATDKPQLLTELAQRAALALGMAMQVIRDALMTRERLGSTGIGSGVAIPHARIDGLKDVFALFTRLPRPIDFVSIDGRPVDLVCLLLSPLDGRSEHLAALACVSRRLRNESVAQRLRGLNGAADLYGALVEATP